MRKISGLMCAMLFAGAATLANADTRTSDTTNPNSQPQQSVDKLHQHPEDVSTSARDADGSNAAASKKDIHELKKKSDSESKAYQSNKTPN